MTAFVQKRCRG